MSVGILTSGGDAPGMNAAVRAAFRGLKMSAPDSELLLFRDGFRGLARRLDSSSDRNVDRKAVRDIIHRGGTFLGTGRVSELLMPPDRSAPDHDERLAAREAFLRVAAVNLFQTQVESLLVIGGDGSFRGARVIAEAYRATFPKRPFRVIGIPGTIDNDLHGTDFSIGYDTALNNVVDSIRKLRDTIESHRRAIILEVMGNTSGWLALQSAIAGGAAVVAIPEVEETWDIDQILPRLIAGVRRDYRYFVIVVAEGVLKRAGADWSQRLKRASSRARRSTTASATRWRRASTRSATSPAADPVGPRQHARGDARRGRRGPRPGAPAARRDPRRRRRDGRLPRASCDRHAAR
jgi:6-phosphofructokinase 1